MFHLLVLHICLFYCTNLVFQPNEQADSSLRIKTDEEIENLLQEKERIHQEGLHG